MTTKQKQNINDNIPTITTPRGSAKPDSVANLNACHLLRHASVLTVKKLIFQINLIWLRQDHNNIQQSWQTYT